MAFKKAGLKESGESAAMEAKSHSKGFLKKALKGKSSPKKISK